MFKKTLKLAILTLLTYLVQATIPPLIPVFDIAPNIAMAVLAVVSIALGIKYTLFMSIIIGYFLEITQPAVNYINTLIYPICAVLIGMIFADKSERKISEDRARQKQTKQLHPLLRTVFCAAVSMALFEFVFLMYTYLSGVTLTFDRFIRALISVLYTTAITAVLQFPLRLSLGIHKQKKKKSA